MTPDEYLLLSIKCKCYRLKAWIINAFTVTQESESQKADLYPGKLIREPFGFFAVKEDGEKVQIKTDKKANEPLFHVRDRITITRDWIPTLSTPISSIKATSLDTSIGTLLVNLICLYEPFNGKFLYTMGRFSPSDLEDVIAARLESTPKEGQPRKDTVFYVDEYLKFCEAVTFLETLSPVFTNSITQKGLLPAPGRREFKKQILTKYEGKLTDPVEMAKFEDDLKKFDQAWIQDDPSYGKFLSGKVTAARMAAFMTQGGESNNFTGEMTVTPIIQGLEDGIALDEKGFTASANTIRYGSFARGAETVNGGVVAKALMRAADNWRITEGDCGSNLGITRLYDEKDIGLIVGRYLIVNGKTVLIEDIEQAQPFSSRKIVVRSPQYCRRPGTQTCEVCAGKALAKNPTGLPIPLMEVSGGILADSLKQMHSSKLETATVSLSKVIS